MKKRVFNKQRKTKEKDIHQQAVQWYDADLQNDPENLNSVIGKADALRRSQKHYFALILYDRALSFNPSVSQMIARKGTCLNEMKNLRKALICLRYSQILEPNNEFFLQKNYIINHY